MSLPWGFVKEINEFFVESHQNSNKSLRIQFEIFTIFGSKSERTAADFLNKLSYIYENHLVNYISDYNIDIQPRIIKIIEKLSTIEDSANLIEELQDFDEEEIYPCILEMERIINGFSEVLEAYN